MSAHVAACMLPLAVWMGWRMRLAWRRFERDFPELVARERANRALDR